MGDRDVDTDLCGVPAQTSNHTIFLGFFLDFSYIIRALLPVCLPGQLTSEREKPSPVDLLFVRH